MPILAFVVLSVCGILLIADIESKPSIEEYDKKWLHFKIAILITMAIFVGDVCGSSREHLRMAIKINERN